MMDRRGFLTAIAAMPNCSTPDCEFKAAWGSEYCYCHARGFNPPLTFEQYEALDATGASQYRKRLRVLENGEMAVNRRGFLLAVAGAFTIDPDRLLWRPGEKHFSIPEPDAVRMAYSTPIGFDYYVIDWAIPDNRSGVSKAVSTSAK